MKKKELIKKKKAVLRKLYGGKRKAWMHDFRLKDGVCKHCGAFLGDKDETLLCRVITPDEVSHFTDYDSR